MKMIKYLFTVITYDPKDQDHFLYDINIIIIFKQVRINFRHCSKFNGFWRKNSTSFSSSSILHAAFDKFSGKSLTGQVELRSSNFFLYFTNPLYSCLSNFTLKSFSIFVDISLLHSFQLAL